MNKAAHLTSMKSFSSARLRTRYSATFPSSAGFSLSKTMSASQASANSFNESTEALRSSVLRPLAVPSTKNVLKNVSVNDKLLKGSVEKGHK